MSYHNFSYHLQVLLFIFSIIRRKFGDHGRLALVADNARSVHNLTNLRLLIGVVDTMTNTSAVNQLNFVFQGHQGNTQPQKTHVIICVY